MLLTFALFLKGKAAAHSYATWYKNTQQRIDTLCKSVFGIRIVNEQGNPFTSPVLGPHAKAITCLIFHPTENKL